MGCGGSSQSSNPKPAAARGAAGPQIPQEPPYNGPPCTYNFVTLQIGKEVKTGLIFSPNTEFQTLVESMYLPALSDLYQLGYRMVSFCITPGSITASGFVSLKMDSKLKTQGIFRQVSDEEKGKWRLRVEKSCLPQQVFTYGMFNIGATAQPDHIFQTIDSVSKEGGRLVAVEVTGGSFSGGQTTTTSTLGGLGGKQMNVMLFGHNPNTLLGVDIFFDMPVTPSSDRYIYSCVPLRMICEFNPFGGMMGGSWKIQFDWFNLVSQYLGQGWRFVEVFLDQNNKQSTDRAFMATKMTMDVGAMFIFEKEASKQSDNTPIYEVKMVEYRAPGKMAMSGIGSTTVTVNSDWDGVIQNEGRNGWELVKILQTPATMFKQTISFTPEFGWVHYMFFQRKIVAAPVQQSQSDAPPEPVQAPQTTQ